MKLLQTLVVLATISLIGCVGTDTGNPSLQSSVGVNTRTSDPSVAALREGDAVVVEEVWVSFGEVGVLSEEECETAGAAQSVSLALGDHAGEPATFVTLTVPSGDYCAAVVSFATTEAPLPEGAPAQLEGNSIVVVGRLPDGTVFRYVSSITDRFRLNALEGDAFELNEQASDLLLTMDVATWVGAVDIASATRLPSGDIELSNEHNPTHKQGFDQALPSGFELYFDLDGDGAIDDDSVLIARGVR